MNRMDLEHASSVRVVEGMETSDYSLQDLKIGRLSEALRESDLSSADISLQVQLENAISLLEAKKDDNLLGVCTPSVFLI